MLTLLKRDVTIYWPSYVMILCIPLFAYLIHLPNIPFSTYIMFLYIFLATVFYQDGLTQINRFLISLPLPKWKIVLARYISVTVATVIGAGGILWFETTFHDTPVGTSSITTIGLYTIIMMILIVALPVFYIFNRMWKTILVQIFIFIIGNALFFIVVFTAIFDVPVDISLSVIDMNPYLVLPMFSIVLWWGSYFVSYYIYKKKDH